MFNGNIAVFGGNFIGRDNAASRAFEKLAENVASGALHDSGEISEPPKCQPGTRTHVLGLMLTWATLTTYHRPIKWLNGPAGAGKSAIMRTLAEMLVDHSLLLATFFFFRSASMRNTNERLIATLAFQICSKIPVRSYLEEAIEHNPLIFSASIPTQIQALIINPLLCYFYDPNSLIINPFPRIILIDGLDECTGTVEQQEIIMVFSKMVKTLPIPLAIIIASRPELPIRIQFGDDTIRRSSEVIRLDEGLNPQADIETFYMAEFQKIQTTHPMKFYLDASWPHYSVVAKLVRNASGQFIYAATIMKFIKSIRHNPSIRLKMVLGIIDCGNVKPFEQLDLLYTLILSNVDPEVLPAALQVLGIILDPSGFSPSEIQTQSPAFLEFLLGFEPGHIQSLLSDLQSLVKVTSNYLDIQVFHTSLSDFLFDKSRAGNLFIEKSVIHATIARSCIRMFLSPNFGQLPEALRLNDCQVQGRMINYFCEKTYHCLVNASPTGDLREAIEACDMAELLEVSFPGAKGIGLNFLAPTFLEGVEQSCFPDAARLYEKKFRSFTAVVVPFLIDYWQQPQVRGFRVPFLTLLSMELQRINCYEASIFVRRIFPGAPNDKSLLPDFEPNSRRLFTAGGLLDSERIPKLVIQAMLRPDGLLRHPKGRTAWTELTLTIMSLFSTDHAVQPQLFEMRGEKRPILPFLLARCPPNNALVQISERVQTSGPYRRYPPYAAAINSYLERSQRAFSQQMTPPDMLSPNRETEKKKWLLSSLFCCG